MTLLLKKNPVHFLLSLCTAVTAVFAAPATIAVRGAIMAPDGTVIPGSRVIFSSNGDPRKMIEFPTAASGVFTVSLMPGIGYNVRIMAPGYPLQYFDKATPDVTADGPPSAPIIFNDNDSITVYCTATPRKLNLLYGWIAGTVWDSAGSPLAQARIMALAPGRDVTAEEQTDEQGRYVCRVPMQPHFISASSYNYPVQFWGPAGTTSEPASSGLLAVAAEDTLHADIRLKTNGQPVTQQFPPAGGISGRATLTTTSQPAVGVVVCAIRSDSAAATVNSLRYNLQYVQPPYSDTVNSDGSYSLANMPRGNYFVFTKPQKYPTQFFSGADSVAAATPVAVDSTITNNVDFSLRPGATISGSVTTKDAKPLGKVQVSCSAMKASFSMQTQTDSSGNFLITGLSAGTYCINIIASTFLSGSDANQCNYTVAEGATLSGISLTAQPGGIIRAAFTSPVLQDSLKNASLEIGLFSDSLTSSQNVLNERWTTGAGFNYATAGEFFSSAIPAGKWRYVIRPSRSNALLSSLSPPYAASRAYSFGNAASFSAQTPIVIAGGDTVRLPTVNFTKGFSVFGSISLEGGEKGLSGRVTAYVKDSRGFVPVARSYTADSSFELPGLVDGQEYCIGVEVPTYPPQFWSPQGSTGKPSNMYRFSTGSFIPLTLRAVKTPQGFTISQPGLSVWLAADSAGATGRYSVNCSAPSGGGVDSLILFGKDGYGAVATIAKFLCSSRQSVYSWTNSGNAAEAYQTYVFVGKGPNASIRSGLLWPDPFMGRKPASGGLLVALLPMRSGVQVNWRSDSMTTAGKVDTVVFKRKSGADTAYSRYAVSWGVSGSFWDGSIEKTAAGTTVYYKVELWSSGLMLQSLETKFLVTQAFLDKLPKRLRVGPYEQYKTVQQAIDAAADGDIVGIAPGTYQENISLKGKAVSLEGDWQGGAPPVIDGIGGVAVKVPYTSKSSGYNTIGIGGLKIVNALTGIAAYGNVSVNQCLFVNLLREAVLCSADSAAAVLAAAADPFAQVQTDQNFWQCTFIGNNRSAVALRASSATGAAGADTAAVNRTPMTPGGNIKVDNSIFAQYASTALPIDVKDARFTVVLRTCDFWQASVTASSPAIKLEPPQYRLDPQFKDTVNYFLGDNSQLSGIADGKASIGYDSRGYRAGPDQPRNEPDLPPVKNIKAAAAGPHSISVSWSPLPDTVIYSGYMVFRIDGFDSLFAENAQAQWEPKIAKDSLFMWVDTFRTTATSFLDTTVVAGKPYVYAVAGVSPDGGIGRVDMPSSRPFADYVVKIEPSRKIDRLSAAINGFTDIMLAWRPVSASSAPPLYTLYRIPGNDSLASLIADSAAVRRLAKAIRQGLVKADAITVGDSFYVDTTALLGAAYLYVATVSDPLVPFEDRPLTCAAVRVDSMAYQERRSMKIAANRWHMIGPWGMDGSLAFDSASVVYRWDDDKPADKLYSQYVRTAGMRSAEGYWFKCARDTTLTISEAMHRSVVRKRDSLFITLRKGLTGWNQVSSALPFAVRPGWLANGSYTAYAWDGDSAQYTDQAALKPWKGYWIHTDRDTQLPIRPSDVSVVENDRTMGKRSAQAHWELKVSLSGDGNDPDNYLGVIAPSAAKTGRLAYPKPPQTFEYAQLFFIDAVGKNVPAQKDARCAKLYKAAAAEPARKLEWTVGISPSLKVTTVKVSGVPDVPDKVALFWVSGAAAVNLRESPEITIPAHEQSVFGYIVATTNPRDVGIYTRHFELRGCFPNPVRSIATIEFTVPYSWNIDGSKKDGETRQCELGVYDMAGRCVATVFSGKISVGDHKLMWRGASDAGHLVAQGAYVIRLSGSDFQKTLKIMRLR